MLVLSGHGSSPECHSDIFKYLLFFFVKINIKMCATRLNISRRYLAINGSMLRLCPVLILV